MANKAVISVVSIVLVVGVIISMVAVVNHGKIEKQTNHISTNTKTIDSFCKPTEYKDVCNEVMGEVAKNASATNQDYIIACISATTNELQKAIEKAKAFKNDIGDKDDSTSYCDLQGCEKMLSQATDEQQQVLKVVSETQANTIAQQIDPILVWLTAVRAYQTTCLDEIRDPKLKYDMQQDLQTSNELTYNAQKIIYNVNDILKDTGVDVGDFKLPPNGNRKLLHELHEIEHHGFPSWVPTFDRKLLAKNQPDVEMMFKTPTPPFLPPTITPNVVVSLDENEQFNSIKEALAAYPLNQQGRYIIYIKERVYDEGQVIVEKNQMNVYMYGDGSNKTIITGSLHVASRKVGTSTSATFIAIGERFMARGICFRNTIGPKGGQAVAFRSISPHIVMMEYSFEAYQDTLYYHTHDQFYKNCVISGTVDFIFGSGRAFIQDSEINIRKPDMGQKNIVMADGRMKYEEAGGVVIHNSKIMAVPELESTKAQFNNYLGRPWKPAATSVVMKCNIGDVILQEGWTKWESPQGKNNHMTCTYREFDNMGPGSNTTERVKWAGFKVITNEKEALDFTANTFLAGGTWLPKYGVSVNLGL